MTNSKHRSLFQYYNFHTWMSLGDCSWAMALEQNSQQENLCSIFPLLLLYVESVFIHTNTSSLQTLGSPSLPLHAANQGGGSEELLKKKKQIEQGRKGKRSSIPWPLDQRDHQELLVLSPDLPVVTLEAPSRSPYVCQHLFSWFWLFGWEKRHLQPHCFTELSSTRTSSLPSRSTPTALRWPDRPKCFNSSLPTWSRKFPHARCALQTSGGGGASRCLHSTGLQALLAPSQRVGRMGTFLKPPQKTPVTLFF